jgi:hypothetical protein
MELATGVHSLPLDVLLELVRLIDVRPNHVSWEIGCGELLVSFGLSAASHGGIVVATDLCECDVNECWFKNKLFIYFYSAGPVVEKLRANVEMQEISRQQHFPNVPETTDTLVNSANDRLNDAVRRQENAYQRSRLQRCITKKVANKRQRDVDSEEEETFLNENNMISQIEQPFEVSKTDSIFGDSSESDLSDEEQYKNKFRKRLLKWEEASADEEEEEEENDDISDTARDSDDEFIDNGNDMDHNSFHEADSINVGRKKTKNRVITMGASDEEFE